MQRYSYTWSVTMSVLAVLCLLFPCALAVQSQCDNGMGSYPCPSISSSVDRWGVTWRNYSAIGIAGKGVFGAKGAILQSLSAGYPDLVKYFNGSNAVQQRLERTLPVGVLMAAAGNQTAYMTIFFLPDQYLSKPPMWTNSTGFLHLNSWPTDTATFNPIVYSFLNRANDAVIQENLILLTRTLNAHKQPYYTGLTAYIAYDTPDSHVQQNEVWVFQDNPFPGHSVADLIAMANARDGKPAAEQMML